MVKIKFNSTIKRLSLYKKVIPMTVTGCTMVSSASVHSETAHLIAVLTCSCSLEKTEVDANNDTN